jgi:hypothetical protein
MRAQETTVVHRRSLAATLAIFLSIPALGATLRVPADYGSVQAGIDAAAEGDTVLVAPGIYVITEPINFNRLHDPADAASPPVKNICVKSQGGAEATTIRMSDGPLSFDRASVVIFENGEGNASTLEGFTLMRGKGSKWGSAPPILRGGGLLCTDGSAPTLANCTISGNRADYGSGVFCHETSPKLIECTISGNWASTSGAGMSCFKAYPTLTNCTIAGNSAEYGGGIHCGTASPTLIGCMISTNSGTWGGGVFCNFDASPVLTNCTLLENSGTWGGGIYCGPASPKLTNCTIAGNSANTGNNVFCGDSASPQLTNCIVWGNALSDETFCGTLLHCLTDQDPLFVEPGHWDDNGTPDVRTDDIWIPGDYHLQPDSPGIDSGALADAPTTDMEGHGRPCGAGVDIGAYEFGDCTAPETPFRRGDSNADGTTDVSDAATILIHLFRGEVEIPCEQAGDTNDDGSLDISDAVYVLRFLFLGGSAVVPPVGDCGVDPIEPRLSCESYPGCE